MEYLLTAKEIKACDEATIKEYGMPSMVLMERAAIACLQELKDMPYRDGKILVVCGIGNNGGDGFAVARLLKLEGRDVFVYFPGKEESCTEETRLQKKICEKYGLIFVSNLKEGEYTVIVDAIFGVGLSRNIEGFYKEVIDFINRQEAAVLSVDIPSGIHADTGQMMGAAVKADTTVTFAYQKPGLVLFPGAYYAGKVRVRDIGIYLLQDEKERASICSMTKEDLKLLPSRPAYSNKGTYGKVLVIAGSRGMCGAAYFAAMAAYRMGTGLVRIFTEECNRGILQTLLPEAMITSYESGEFQEEVLCEAVKWADALVFGPGIGKEPEKEKLLETVLGGSKKPLVLDADGLNIAAANKALLRNQSGRLVITPHLGEMARFCGREISWIQTHLMETAKSIAREFGVICVLKDARTIIHDGTFCYINQSGNAGMATGGSGDVLAGILGGLLAQKAADVSDMALGVYLHGLAGDAAAQSCSGRAMTASDLLEGLKEVLKSTDGGKYESL